MTFFQWKCSPNAAAAAVEILAGRDPNA